MTPPNWSLILIMICFWVTFWLVQKFLIRPITGVLAERGGRIAGAEREWAGKHEAYLSASKRLEAELEEAARDAARLRAEQRQQAQGERQKLLDAARADAERRLDDALLALDRDAVAAREDLKTRANALGRAFAERLIGRELAS
jgi:F-type H+-transporting ATPase subunit b